MKKIKIPSRTEHEEQRDFVAWFRHAYPTVRILAIPNGGARSPATAGRLKVEGVCAGVPDLFIPAWDLWIEMKRTMGGSLSAAQKDWIVYLQGINTKGIPSKRKYAVIVARGCNDAKEQLANFCHENGYVFQRLSSSALK